VLSRGIDVHVIPTVPKLNWVSPILAAHGDPAATVPTQLGLEIAMELEVDAYPLASVQWYYEGVAITGATSLQYVIPRVMRSHMGAYVCRVRVSVCGHLVVLVLQAPAPPSPLVSPQRRHVGVSR
jgi:hypothetical protein